MNCFKDISISDCYSVGQGKGSGACIFQEPVHPIMNSNSNPLLLLEFIALDFFPVTLGHGFLIYYIMRDTQPS